MNNHCRLWTVALRCIWKACPGILFYILASVVHAAALPEGVSAEWDFAKAYRETTVTREQICINGLWRWQPAEVKSASPDPAQWGYFKVPGSWPGVTDYMQKDSQTLFKNEAWNNVKPGTLNAAWHEREISVPQEWSGRRILLKADYVNSLANVLIDGKQAGELHFPGGTLDLTSALNPGTKHRLSLLVIALPLKGVMLSYIDTASAREVKGTVARKGLCGDVFLVSELAGPGITETSVETSVRKREISLSLQLKGLQPSQRYKLKARILKKEAPVREFSSREFQAEDLQNGRFTFAETWMPKELWDLNKAGNIYTVQVSLVDPRGRVLDEDWKQSFGFREFWIDGRDFYLNGSRIFLSAVPLDNAQVGAALANYTAARETFSRLKSFGINYVYTHNYGCEPGAHLSFSEILRAADDEGMLVGLTQPHFSHYEWKDADADKQNGYAAHAAFYAKAAGNHPSTVMYVMSHNSTGYEEDMNPDMIDGLRDGRDQWGSKNVGLANRAEAIVRKLDPRRIVYHHASGNLGVMHDMNFYPNFAPVQELDDWFGHWATAGVKPAFTCEYGAPFTWDWTMYRGWYKGQREWGSAVAPWEFCLAEWNAQFFGDRAFEISDAEKVNLRWEAAQVKAGKVWHRWDYPNQVGSDRFTECYPVFAKYTTDNWRAYRTWGVSGVSPWEYGHFWKLRPGADRKRKELKVDWEHLQKPGFSADFIDQTYERMDLAYEKSDWMETAAAVALIRNNRPLLAYIGGKQAAFTSKDHNFSAGDLVEKQIIVINNSREQVTANITWSVNSPGAAHGSSKVKLETGEQSRVPFRFQAPKTTVAKSYEVKMEVQFSSGEKQEDRFVIDVLPASKPQMVLGSKIGMFDPLGQTTELLQDLGVKAERIQAETLLNPYDVVIIGKGALTLEGAAPDIRRLRDGLKVLVFEQTSEALEKRLGFRVQEYGLRQVFPRVPDHPALAGIGAENLRDWHGSSALTSDKLKYEMRSRYGPTVEAAGLPQTRVWRAGNRGNVASVLIEKPARGNFLPILDGGFSLQYSPLLEFHEGKGMALFCQLDVTGRTESDPTAKVILRNLLDYVSNWKPSPARQAVYAGEESGKSFLTSLGISTSDQITSTNDTLILGPGSKQSVAPTPKAIADFVSQGGHVVSIGLDTADLPSPSAVSIKSEEYIASQFAPFPLNSPFAGVGPADAHNRDPRKLPLISGGAEIYGDGVLAKTVNSNGVFLQMAPWQFHNDQQSNLRRTFRRSAFAANRVLANMGVASSTPLLDRFSQPVVNAKTEKRYLEGFYVDQPEEWDDPYRFFRW